MSVPTRALGVAAAALAVAVVALALTGRSAADDKSQKEAVTAVRKLAEAIYKNDEAAVQKGIAAMKNTELADIMVVFKPRMRGGLGVGEKPGAIIPDHIELKLVNVGKRPMTKVELDAQADALAQMGCDIAAVASVVTDKCPVTKKEGDKDPKDWAKWTAGMKEAAGELTKAAKAKDLKAIQAAATKINNNCNSCHSPFRDS